MAGKQSKQQLFGQAQFDIEHALGMYAYSFFFLSADLLYDQSVLDAHRGVLDTCHIYMIGMLPSVEYVSASQDKNILTTTYLIHGKEQDLEWTLPDDAELKSDRERDYLQDQSGTQFWLNENEVLREISKRVPNSHFHVLYIGQAYGHDGSRNAIDRLTKHETLQKIALKGVADGFKLCLLLLATQPQNSVFTVINPWAEERDEDGSRVDAGLDKLYGTTERERVSVYEAALIRYFSPQYNKEFKNSFPSTNLKVLQDCYAKDFAAVIAEICIDELPFQIGSDVVEPTPYHIAKYGLHDDERRRMFFGL